VGKFTVLVSFAYSEFQAYSKGLIFSTYPTIEECISGSSSAILTVDGCGIILAVLLS